MVWEGGRSKWDSALRRLRGNREQFCHRSWCCGRAQLMPQKLISVAEAIVLDMFLSPPQHIEDTKMSRINYCKQHHTYGRFFFFFFAVLILNLTLFRCEYAQVLTNLFGRFP